MSDQELHRLTDLQLDVMRVLWERGEATAAEVHEALLPMRGLAPTTVATLLRRLEKRGVVSHRSEGRQYVYRPHASERQVRRSMVGELTERLFDGDATELISYLVSSGEIGPGDLERLRRLVEEREREEADDG